MMQLGVISSGTLVQRTASGEADGGLRIGLDLLEAIGLEQGDELEIHSDGSMLMIVPVHVRGQDDH